MKIRDLIDELIKVESVTAPDAEVKVIVRNIPYLGAIHGCWTEEVKIEPMNEITIVAVAP